MRFDYNKIKSTKLKWISLIFILFFQMEMIQFDKNLLKFILICFSKNETTQPQCNSSTVNTDESRRSEDAVTTGV